MISYLGTENTVDNEKENKGIATREHVCVYAMHKLTPTYGRFVPHRPRRPGVFPLGLAEPLSPLAPLFVRLY